MSQKFGKCDICDIVLAGQIGSQCDMGDRLFWRAILGPFDLAQDRPFDFVQDRPFDFAQDERRGNGGLAQSWAVAEGYVRCVHRGNMVH